MLRLTGLDRQLDQHFPEYRDLISPLPLSIVHARSALGKDEGLLLLVASNGDVHSFAVGPQGSAWSRAAGGAAEAGSQLALLQCQVDPEHCRAGEPADTRKSPQNAAGHPRYDLSVAHALYATLIAPVEAPLARARTVYVVASGFLGDLPLAMLVTAPPATTVDDGDPAVLATAPWLGERYAFVQLPAVAVLRLKLARTPASRLAVLDGYGDPVLGEEGLPAARSGKLFRTAGSGLALADPSLLRSLPSLPGTRRELAAMATAVGATGATLHLQRQATEREVKHDPALPAAGIVVFATQACCPAKLARTASLG